MFAVLLCLLAADPEPTPALKVLASGEWRHARHNGKKALVLRKGEDLADLTPYNALDALPSVVGASASRDLAADLKVKEIDWNTQMVLLILAGQKPTNRYSVEVTGLKVSGTTLTVTWKLNEPKGAAGEVITYPNLAVVVPKFAGKVVFRPALDR